MTTYKVKVYVENPITGVMKDTNELLHIKAKDVDKAKEKIRKIIKDRKLPKVRAVSLGEDNTFYAYCAIEEPAKVIAGKTCWRKPRSSKD